MSDHAGVLMMQRMLLAGTLGLAMARKAAAILEGEPYPAAPRPEPGDAVVPAPPDTPEHAPGPGQDQANGTGREHAPGREPVTADGAVLRAILDAANECLGYVDDRPPGDRWCDTLFRLLDLAAFAAELS